MILIGSNDFEMLRDDLKNLNFIFATTNYQDYGYEGSGHLIACLDKNDWHYNNCGHCSCFGPLTDLDATPGTGLPLEDLIDTFSDDLKEECKELIEHARRWDKG